jgi:sugar phosphate isomerase/epimerase
MTNTASIELGIAHLPLLGIGPPELFDVAAQAGYRRTGLRMYALGPGVPWYPVARKDAAALRRRAQDAGVEIFDAEFVPLLKDLEPDALEGWMEVAAMLGAQRVNCGAADDPDLARCAERFGALCDVAARHGLGVDVEFMRYRPPVATLADAVDLVTRAGRPNGRILVDLLHVARSGGTAADLAKLPASLIGHVQLSDAPLAAPPDDALVTEARGRTAAGRDDERAALRRAAVHRIGDDRQPSRPLASREREARARRRDAGARPMAPAGGLNLLPREHAASSAARVRANQGRWR